MKAKDLAALAALGIAGFAAADKFGKKSPANSGAKAGAKLGDDERDGEAGERDARMNMRDMNEGSGRRDAGGNTVDVDRRVGAPERERDMNEGSGRRDAGGNTMDVDRRAGVPERAAASASDAFKKVKDKSSRSLNSTGGPSRYSREAGASTAEAAAARPAGYEGVVSAAELGSQSFNSNLPAAQSGSPYSDVVPKGELGSQDFRSNAKRLYDLNEASGAANPASVLTDAYGNLSRAEKHVDVTKKAANAAPLIAKSSALANVSHATQAAAMARKRAVEKQAKMNEYARLDELNKSNFVGGRRAKGGAVKMASGGMTSSKMSSKPSTASSRGDGIAQRGKTRGKLC